MGKIEQVMKYEIVRLAKKQVRAVCVPLGREVRHLRRTVSELRKTVKAFKNFGTEYQAQRLAEKARLEASPDETASARLSAGLIKSLRRRLGLTQGELAALVGVSTAAVGFWEQGAARPKGRNKAAIVALRKLGRREVRKLLALKTPAAGKRVRKIRKVKKAARRRRRQKSR